MYSGEIEEYLDKEVKMRVDEVLKWDVSYKVTKHLSKFKGQPVFRGLLTAMNELGEVRMQFFLYSDSHDQMVTVLQLKAFNGTNASLGMPGPQHFITDNPAGDNNFFKCLLPSLAVQQKVYNSKQ